MAVFAHRNYRLFFAGQSVSLTGTWMQQVAQAWLVLGLTGDPLALGIIQAVQFLPSCFLGLFAGLLADILPRRQTLIAAQTAMALLAGLLAILTAAGVVQVWMVITLGFLLGCASAVDMPVRHAFVRELVGPEELGDAIALNATNVNVARVVGPALAGIDDRPRRRRGRVRAECAEFPRGDHRIDHDAGAGPPSDAPRSRSSNHQ